MVLDGYEQVSNEDYCKLLRSAIEAGDKDLINDILETLIVKNTKLVRSLLHKHYPQIAIRGNQNSAGYNGLADDFVQTALLHVFGGSNQLGCIRNYLDMYDEAKDGFPIALTTFIARNALRGFAIAASEENGRTVHEQNLVNRYGNAVKALAAEGNADPTPYEIAEKMNVRSEAAKHAAELVNAQTGLVSRDNDDVPDGYNGADYETPEAVMVRKEQKSFLSERLNEYAKDGPIAKFRAAMLCAKYGTDETVERVLEVIPTVFKKELQKAMGPVRRLFQRGAMDLDASIAILETVCKTTGSAEKMAVCQAFKTNNLLLKKDLINFMEVVQAEDSPQRMYNLLVGLCQGQAEDELNDKELGRMFSCSTDAATLNINNIQEALRSSPRFRAFFGDLSRTEKYKSYVQKDFYNTDPILDWDGVFVPSGIQDSLLEGMMADRGDLFEDGTIVEATAFAGDIVL